MKRITQITLSNYRAFYNEKDNENKYQINLPQGENLLVYGENGSGKSSLFKALEDFFLSAGDSSITVQENIFTTAQPDLPAAEVKVKFSEKDPATHNWNLLDEIVLNNDAPTSNGNALLNDASKAFLTYRNILKTYFLDIDNGDENPNLFDLLLNILLGRITDASTNKSILDNLKDIELALQTFDDAVKEAMELPDDEEPEKKQGETKGIKVIKEEITGRISDDIDAFNLSITEILDEAILDVNSYLKDTFKTNIEVSIKNRDSYIKLIPNGSLPHITKALYFNLKYYNSEIENQSYQVFLNEARLSALAICTYIAAVKRDKPAEDNFKFIFLDDIFIGLDTSNRLPLLEILKKDFDKYQIVITTYDRHWFELAKDWFERKTPNQWKFYELYSDDYSYSDKEIPKLLPFKNSLAQALYYYKQSDYSASGNYLRKACEETLRKILPSICFKSTDGLDMTKLSNMLEKAIFFFNVLEKPIDELNSLSVYLQSLMNPLSHYDINISVYRKEIKDVEKAIKNLQLQDFSKTTFKQVLDKNTMLKLTYRVNADTENVYEIEIKDDLWIYKLESTTDVCLGAVPCKNINLYEVVRGFSGQIFHNKLESCSLKQFYENAVNHENRRNPSPNIAVISDYGKLYEYNDGKGRWESLTSLIKF